MFDWNDLRFLLATVRCGTFSAAGEELGVNRTTVARRVTNLEKKAAVRLLEPSSTGLKPTTAGRALIELAINMEKQVQQATDSFLSADYHAVGPLRLAAPTGLGAEFMPEIAQFCAAYPSIELELVTSSDPAALVSQRKADVCIAVSNHPPEHLTATVIGELKRALYGSTRYLKTIPANTALKQLNWVFWGKEMSHTLIAKWMQSHLPDDISIAARVNSWTAMREAISNDLGVSYLWCFLADEDTDLQQLRAPLAEVSMGLWLMVHEDVPVNARVEALLSGLPSLLKNRITKKGLSEDKPLEPHPV
ncbi:MAG: LysR family transcriptional regulator [Pseudomonadales bacterium]